MPKGYTRVLPRDLFRESLLLKCLGKLCLLIHDNEITWLTFRHGAESYPFAVDIRESDGGLSCGNVCFYRKSDDTFIEIYTGLARPGDSWPLLACVNAEEVEVFDSDGDLNPEFKEAVEGEEDLDDD